MQAIPDVKIIALNGSPHRNGNTATLMKWVVEGCERAGARVQWFDIAKMTIGYCQGCHHCLRTGECRLDDDMTMLKQVLMSADGVVIGSPVYEDGVTAQLKTMMDRLALFELYLGIFDEKWSVGVATSGIAPTRGVARAAVGIFGRRAGIIGSTTAKFEGGYRAITESEYPKLQKRARRLGKRLVRCIQKTPRFNRTSLKMAWIRFLRRTFLVKLITKNEKQFAGIVRIWKERGWL